MLSGTDRRPPPRAPLVFPVALVLSIVLVVLIGATDLFGPARLRSKGAGDFEIRRAATAQNAVSPAAWRR
jgi:hypothetical protein